MAEVIRMPLLSDTMKEGKIVQWLKKVGDNVKSDDVLAEVQTDKATMEVLPYVDGTLLHIGVPEGEAAAIDQIIAIVGKAGEDFSSLLEEKPIATPVVEEMKKVENNPEQKALPPDVEVVRMPLLSDTMKAGKIATWLKNVGDKVKSDDVLAEVETDKATMEVMGYAEGTLLYQGATVGNAVDVNGVLAIVGNENTNIEEYLPTILAESTKKDVENPIAIAKPAMEEVKQETKQVLNTNTQSNGRVKASPLAKKIAKEKGLDLSQIHGSGDGGRVILRDVENYNPTTTSSKPSFSAQNATESYTDTPISQMRAIIAQRLGESKFSAPHFYLKISVEMDDFLKMRKQVNEFEGLKVSVNDMIIKAVAMALQKHPDVNSSWLGDKIRQNHHIHIGSAVAIPDGLIVPVIKFANQKRLSEIAEDTAVLNQKAKSGKLQPNEFSGNTFTISNLGMLGIEEFTAIINPPDACILAVGSTKATPVVAENNEIKIKQIMKLTLSCDHRVVDGAVGASFLQTLKMFIEQPVLMFL